jgi:Spy/CpxP family protein refolding chaperone
LLSILLLGTVPTTTKLVGVALALVAAVFLAIEPAPAPDAPAPQTKSLKEYGRS